VQDVPIIAGMEEWTHAQVTEYFETAGAVRPLPAEELASRHKWSHAGSSNEAEAGRVGIGGVWLDRARASPTPLVPSVQALFAPSELAAMRWMMQNLALGQDMLLLGDPSPRMRRLALGVCGLLHREAEYVGISRDST
jgi:hypothetical protein